MIKQEKMNKTYFIRQFIETPNSISSRKDIDREDFKRWKFKLESGELILYDSKLGLFTDCYIEADSSEKAELLSTGYTEHLVSIIDYLTASSSPSSHFVLIYEATENVAKREFKQIIHTTFAERNIKKINQNAFSDIFLTLDKNFDSRLVRALNWIRKANLVEYHIDKFISYWAGLESISGLLCDYYQIPEEERILKCPHCGKKVFDSFLKGVKELFLAEIENDKDLFYKIRGARNNITHGIVQLA